MHYVCSGAGSQMRPIYPNCTPHGLVSQNGCVTQGQLGSRSPFWHAFFTRSETDSSLDLKGGFAVFSVHDDKLGVRFIEPVPDPVTGRAWRERYAAIVPLGGLQPNQG
jgi:hypothetical protein